MELSPVENKAVKNEIGTKIGKAEKQANLVVQNTSQGKGELLFVAFLAGPSSVCIVPL